MKRTMRTFALAIAIAMLAGVPACAEMIFTGKVTGAETVAILAPFGGIVDSVGFRAGERVRLGDEIATIATTRIYAAVDGTVGGVFGKEGDSTEGITERYGAVLFVEPAHKYTLAATTEKAFNSSDNKLIHIGEKVFLSCVSDGLHTGTGTVISVDENGYKVEVTSGEFYMEESVNICRKSDYSTASRIGRGTVGGAAAVPVKGSGSILKMHVKPGDAVERGQLLFETVAGALDGLFAPGNSVLSSATGIVSEVVASMGASVEKGGKLVTIYPDDAIRIEIQVSEEDLGFIYEGMPVQIEFNWDSDRENRHTGTVTDISYLSATTEGAPAYTARIEFTPDESVRLGMTVLVYTLESHDDAPAAEEELADEGEPAPSEEAPEKSE